MKHKHSWKINLSQSVFGLNMAHVTGECKCGNHLPIHRVFVKDLRTTGHIRITYWEDEK